MLQPIKTEPYFKDVLWGGHTLRDRYHKAITSETTGESFEFSVVPGAECTVGGRTLTECGEDVRLLFKLIDAKAPLSVQVHPDDAAAERLEHACGKTECWYVLAAEKDAFLYLGFRPGVTEEDFARALTHGDMEEILSKVPVRPGDFFYVPAGTVHAIGAGLLIAELQQSCDTTYRVYDYDRVDKNGRKRELHIEKARLCTRVAPYENVVPEKLSDTRERLLRCPYFEICRVTGRKEAELASPYYRILFFESGRADVRYDGGSLPVSAGDTVYLPTGCSVTVDGECRYLSMTEVRP